MISLKVSTHLSYITETLDKTSAICPFVDHMFDASLIMTRHGQNDSSQSVLSVPVTITNRSFDSFSPDGLLRNLARNLITHWQRDRYLLSLAETLR